MDLNSTIDNTIKIFDSLKDHGNISGLIDSLNQTKDLINEYKKRIKNTEIIYLPLISFILKLNSLYSQKTKKKG